MHEEWTFSSQMLCFGQQSLYPKQAHGRALELQEPENLGPQLKYCNHGPDATPGENNQPQ